HCYVQDSLVVRSDLRAGTPNLDQNAVGCGLDLRLRRGHAEKETDEEEQISHRGILPIPIMPLERLKRGFCWPRTASSRVAVYQRRSGLPSGEVVSGNTIGGGAGARRVPHRRVAMMPVCSVRCKAARRGSAQVSGGAVA